MLVYAAISLFGFLILVVLLVAGDIGGDHDAGFSHEVFEHAGGPSVFSVRIMASFLTAFGVGGVLARYYGLSHPAASLVGTFAGVVMSSVVYQFARVLYNQQASSEVHMASLVGRTAEVIVAIPANGVGQISLAVGGQSSDHIARSADDRAIPRGTEVTITALRGDSVIVAPPAGAPGGSQ